MYVLSFPSEQSHYTFGLSTKGYSMPVFLQRYILSTVFVLMLVASSTSQVHSLGMIFHSPLKNDNSSFLTNFKETILNKFVST